MEYYTRALSEDPWLWEAYTGLCDSGKPRVSFPSDVRCAASSRCHFPRSPECLTFGFTATITARDHVPRVYAAQLRIRGAKFYQQAAAQSISFHESWFLHARSGHGCVCGPIADGHDGGKFVGVSKEAIESDSSTPSMVGDTTFPTHDAQASTVARRPLPGILNSMIPAALRSTPNPTVDAPPAKPPAMKRPRGANVVRRPAETPIGGPLAGESRLNGRDMRNMLDTNGDKDGPVRRSSRLNTTTTNKAASSRLTVTRDKRSTRSQSVTSSTSGTETNTPSLEAQIQTQVDDWLRDIVRRCARAYRYLSLYQCQEAIDEIDSLPVEIQASPWAYDMMARCFYEMAHYLKVST